MRVKMTTLDLKIIGRRIRELRKARKMTQIELAKILKVRQSTVSFLESGEVPPGLDFLQAISRTFQVSLDYLVNGGDFIPGELAAEERQLLTTFRELDPKNRELLILTASNARLAARAGHDTP